MSLQLHISYMQNILQSDRTSFKTEEHKNMYYSYEWIDVTMVIVSASSTTRWGEFENSALFLRLGLPSTLDPTWKRSFIFSVRSTVQKTDLFENWRNVKKVGFSFSFDENIFENWAFGKRWRHSNHVITLTEFSSNTNSTWPVVVTFSNFSSVVWTRPIYTLPKVFSLCKHS